MMLLNLELNLSLWSKTAALRASYDGVLFAPVQVKPRSLEDTCLETNSARAEPMPF